MHSIDVFFRNIDKPVSLHFSSREIKEHAFEEMSNCISTGNDWGNIKYLVRVSEVRFIRNNL